MENSRTTNSIRNIFVGAINRFVCIIFPFIVRTIFIRVLGEEYLGVNTLFSSVLQVLNIADLGFANAVVASMYKPIAEGDTDKVSALMSLFRRIYKIIGCVILAVGLIITPFIGYFINGTPPEDLNIYFLWLLYLANAAVGYLFFAYKISLLNAHQRSDISDKIGAVSRITCSVIQIIVVVVFKNMYLYVFLTIINSIMYNIRCSIECDRRYPQYTCKGDLDSETKTQISKNIGALAFQKIGNTVSTSLDSIIISAFLGLTTVAIYGNYYYIVHAITAFVNLIYTAITASTGNSIVTETKEKNYKDFNNFFFMSTWIVGWCSICFVCLFQDFMTIWMGESLLFKMPVVFSLVLRFYFQQIRKVVQTYKDAAGMWWADKWKPVVGCIINLILNIVMVRTIGVIGVMLSSVISYAFVELPWETHVLFKNYFEQSEFKYYIKMLLYTALFFGIGAVTYYLCELIHLKPFFALCIKILICITFPNILFAVINIKNTDFKNSISFVKNNVLSRLK